MDGLTAGGEPAGAVAARAGWRGSREAAGRVRPAVRPPSDAGPARRLRYAAAGAVRPDPPLSPCFFFFFSPSPQQPLRQGLFEPPLLPGPSVGGRIPGF